MQQTDELACFLFITTHPKYISPCGSEVLDWAILDRYHLQTCICKARLLRTPLCLWQELSLAPEALPKAEHSHPDVSLKPSTSAGLSSAPPHSFLPVPSRLPQLWEPLKVRLMPERTLRKRKLSGWLVQGLWYQSGKEREPPCFSGVGAAPSASPAVAAIFTPLICSPVGMWAQNLFTVMMGIVTEYSRRSWQSSSASDLQ